VLGSPAARRGLCVSNLVGTWHWCRWRGGGRRRGCELGARPKYTRRNTTLLGKYGSRDYCPGGFDLCEDARIIKEADGSWSIALGYADQFGGPLPKYPLVPADGVFVFSSGDSGVPGYDDCQDPGCGDVMKVSGVLYPKKVGDAWKPTLKVTIDLEFWHPDEDDAPHGEVRHVSYFTHQ
jgi:hypothetical protein